ncbi:beta-hexosaminidase beta chain [Cordyceps fumosorosea ARSEF 2679]|uniref:Beta-hexosaminidase n=1 Tax=Cordyceps fumosorosea (strain ARSEF 2679) TaxID=1081104 RepID=A0A167R038_CORFA|nr:beta-hexosaminidase beta chain [Cordyceps fumosorosea ARSEF 2679]OAA58147.1 beta-hexosaminidase beta chain [Cordyceps fumosorosea ARSEF 2679]
MRMPSLLAAALAASPVAALWPIPVDISSGNTTLYIDKSISVTYNGAALAYQPGGKPPAGANFTSKAIVEGGLARALDAIFDHGYVPWMLHKPGSEFEPHCGPTDQNRLKSLDITQTGPDDATTFKPLAGQRDESYSLNVTFDGKASISANSSIGVLRGLETFSQLFFRHTLGDAWYTKLAPVSIHDSPVFAHRGMLLDVARHWFPIEDIKRTIDGLAMSKMNVLHLHMTDTQSWPIEIPALPLLTERHAYSKNLTYSPAAIADLQEYGVHRGVQVIMEIDMPGHVGIDLAYPGLSVAYNQRPTAKYCAQPPCGALRLGNQKVEEFLATLFEDLLPRLSPYAAYFHLGGDEYNPSNSLLDPDLNTEDTSKLMPLLQLFISFTHDKVRKHGLVPMVWEEMVNHWNASIGTDVVVQTWLGGDKIKQLAEAGHKVVVSNSDTYYLDCGRGSFLDYENGPALQKAYPFNDWCQPTKNWRLIYLQDPRAGLTGEAAANVIGGEVALWTETVDGTSLDTVAWPRVAAAGESWWSGRLDAQGQNRSMYDARPRLSEMRERMLARGVRGAPITQLWCDQADPIDCSTE